MLRHLHAIFLAFLLILTASTATAYAPQGLSMSEQRADNQADPAGNIVWKENYRPFGERLSNQAASADNRQWFHGKAADTDTGLQYFGARYYDPVLGRFMGVDPVGFQEDNIHSFNKYAYGNNNPYRFIDPDGKQAVGVDVLNGYVGQQWAQTQQVVGDVFNKSINMAAQAYTGLAVLIAEQSLYGRLFSGAAEVIATTRVGRWMSQVELSAMKNTGVVQEGGGGITRVAVPPNASAYKNAPKGDKYVEFDVPTNRLSPHSEGTKKIAGPNSREASIPGRDPANYKMPSATNIVD